MEIRRTYRFEAARRLPRLPPTHPCSRLHGHGFRLEVSVRGETDAALGWVMDFAVLDDALKPLLATLEHRLLNDVEGLENPTCEQLAQWFWRRLSNRFAGLSRIAVYENSESGCVYRGP